MRYYLLFPIIMNPEQIVGGFFVVVFFFAPLPGFHITKPNLHKMKKAKFPSSILRKTVLAFLAINDKARVAQAWNFKDVSTFYLILLARELDVNKPQQWLLIRLQRWATDKNVFLRAASSLCSGGTRQSRQSASGFPDVLHQHRTEGKDKDTNRESHDREKQPGAGNMHFPTLFYLTFSTFLSSCRDKSLVKYIAMTLLCQRLTPIFFLLLPSKLSGRSGTRAAWARLTVGSPWSKACGQPCYNKMLLLPRREF